MSKDSAPRTRARRSAGLPFLVLTAAAVLLSGALLGPALARNEGDAPAELGPDIVILDELEDVYEPVPFDHLSHARMAQMWNGCTTCHHRSPHPDETGDSPTPDAATQDASEKIPACKSCHPAEGPDISIAMPGLKGAYHRQCLSCHKEWMHANACGVCHAPKEGTVPAKGGGDLNPSPGDIVGRMHPPIPEPDCVPYRSRFTPAAGGNVLFRHKAHIEEHEVACASCHREGVDTRELKPMKPGMTWNESHQPCITCHQENACRDCHYRDGEDPPHGPCGAAEAGS